MKRKPLLSLLSCASFVTAALVASLARADTFTYTGAIQTFAVNTTGLYHIVVLGAVDGAGNRGIFLGGLGAEAGGDINLSAGEVLNVAIGGTGQTAETGGGGGGTFVAGPGGTLFAAAGGGGGGSTDNRGVDARAGTSGANGGSNGGGGGGMNGEPAGRAAAMVGAMLASAVRATPDTMLPVVRTTCRAFWADPVM